MRSRMKCSAILFPQNGADVAMHFFNNNPFEEDGILNIQKLKQQLMVCLVDDKGKLDSLAREVFEATNILGRPWVVAQWLSVLPRLNRHYSDMDISGVNKQSMTNLFNELHSAAAEGMV